MYQLIKDERKLNAEQLDCSPSAEIMDFDTAREFLQSPDTGRALDLDDNGEFLSDGENRYPLVCGVPILYPSGIIDELVRGGLELTYFDDPVLQYFLLAQIKQRGEINADPGNVHYQRHLFRIRELVEGCCGTVLDVGCDDARLSSSLFNPDCRYLGLDPFSSAKTDFRIVGVGELLPIRSGVFDNVIFNTSLDHILDYHQALDEALRVLKPGGSLFISTLIWTERASLLSDSVHFHHFREYEIFGALDSFTITKTVRYHYKDDEHRYGLYLKVRK